MSNEVSALSHLPTLPSHVARLRSALSRVRPPTSLEELSDATKVLLGVPLELTGGALVGADKRTRAIGQAPVVAILLRGEEDQRAIVELDPMLALCIVDRTLGGRAQNVPPVAGGALTEIEKGVLGYAVAAILLEATDGGWQLEAIVTDPALFAAMLGRESTIGWAATARLADRKGTVSTWLGESSVMTLETMGRRGALDVAAIAQPLTVQVGLATLSANDYAALEVGDAITMDTRFFEGPSPTTARARIEGSDGVSVWCRVTDEGLVLDRLEHEPGGPITEGKVMSEQSTTDVVSMLGEAQIELSVEIARFTMSLNDLSQATAGQVLLTGKDMGQEVTLRAGQRAIGKGRLVNVEGEVAIALTELARAE